MLQGVAYQSGERDRFSRHFLRARPPTLAHRVPAEALTGPFARGDVATVRKHLAAMKTKKMTEAADLYAALGLRAVKLAESTKRNRRSAKDSKHYSHASASPVFVMIT